MAAPSNDDEHFGGISRKPCRACTDFKTWMKMQGGQNGKRREEKVGEQDQTAAEGSPAGRVTAPASCPPDRDELGRNTWSLLHTTAAYFPERPSGARQSEMRQFVGLFARFYPCQHCAEDFQRDIADHPPAVTSRSALSRWLCDRHNTVNRKLGKPEFDCDLVDERWRDGWKDGSCG